MAWLLGIVLVMAVMNQSRAAQALAVSSNQTPGFCFESGVDMAYKNKEDLKAWGKRYREKHRDELNAKSKEWRKNNPEKAKQCTASWRKEHPENVKQWGANWREKHPEKEKQKSAKYYRKNKDKIREKRCVWTQKRYNSNLNFRISNILRCRVYKAIVNGNKNIKTMELLGCTVEEFIKHLESNWKERMSWENYGRYGWHVDHIIPVSSFDLTCPEQQRACFNYANTQPLWWAENLRKSAKKSTQAKLIL